MTTPASTPFGGLAHVLALCGGVRFVVMSLARPKDSNFKKDDGEKTIQLPIKPPFLTMGSWILGYVARESLRYLPASLPQVKVSELFSMTPMSTYLAGVSMWCLSWSFALSAIRHLNKYHTPVPHGAGVAQLVVKDGPFGFFRHPIYIGMLGSCTAVAFILDSAYSAISLALTAGYLFLWVMPVEEEWMMKKFGKEYIDYCKRVKRLLII
ncbi:hypothetical protein GUITHDRAFT_152529 [Guillardia theta CCMP2712]|uniref:Protein-S-isoprenylcysteine O-methyltransferase n=1 Tax=Guillardia theta (strain CCMP2712) TaxID=905079 RepID=L1JDD1_GUITC|nr:hypothetical protein GUITHDRAFT_152529 [Guillardia theta CCMP2712]EKX46120.1 hypothetical protein GUITHDRAFT_152529 [Guillardia theta CCMP2712]|eukprot:XP_005833100.1 hypothetical protein GUITHDRAFT_152529 [Guillardia theta CCMP2712]